MLQRVVFAVTITENSKINLQFLLMVYGRGGWWGGGGGGVLSFIVILNITGGIIGSMFNIVVSFLKFCFSLLARYPESESLN